MRETPHQLDEQFFVIHPELAALKNEIAAKQKKLQDLEAIKDRLESEMEAAQYELDKRIAVLVNWQRMGERKQKRSGKQTSLNGEA